MHHAENLVIQKEISCRFFIDIYNVDCHLIRTQTLMIRKVLIVAEKHIKILGDQTDNISSRSANAHMGIFWYHQRHDGNFSSSKILICQDGPAEEVSERVSEE